MAVRPRNTSAYGLHGTGGSPACALWLWGNMGAGTSPVSGFFLNGRAGSGPVFRRNRIVSRRKLPAPVCHIHGAGKAMFVSGYACSSSMPYRRQHFFAFTVTFNRTRRNTTRMTGFLLLSVAAYSLFPSLAQMFCEADVQHAIISVVFLSGWRTVAGPGEVCESLGLAKNLPGASPSPYRGGNGVAAHRMDSAYGV